jgi:DNA-directed RNA polymerase specialized sigma24 family protein
MQFRLAAERNISDAGAVTSIRHTAMATNDSSLAGPPGLFASTHWSVVLKAGDDTSPQAGAALDKLCRLYWYPLYAYVRRRGFDAHEAQDLTQEFLARLISKCELPKANPEKGRFRFFLLLRLKHFLLNEWQRLRAEKRGGGVATISLDALDAEERYVREPAHESTPERIFERRWALTVLEGALGRLRRECERDGQGEMFDALKGFLSDEARADSYPELASRLSTTEGALRVKVHRLRQHWRELVREEIAQTVASPAEVEAELRHLREALRNP